MKRRFLTRVVSQKIHGLEMTSFDLRRHRFLRATKPSNCIFNVPFLRNGVLQFSTKAWTAIEKRFNGINILQAQTCSLATYSSDSKPPLHLY